MPSTAENPRILTEVSDLLTLADHWRTQGLTIGFTCGAFDLLHAGHASYLEQAKSLCDRLVVGVNSDDSIRTYKSPHRPIVSQEQRMKLVAALRSVDAVILMTDTRPASIIASLRPDFYIKGGDYGKEELKSAPLVESYGGRCEIIPVEHQISSSQIIARIEDLAHYGPPEQIATSSAPVVLLDRDGTLIENVHFLNDPRRVKLLEGVGEGLRLLQEQGFRLVVVTNQQGIGLGYFNYGEFVATNSAMLRQLAPYGVKISKFYYCPHSFADDCDCRKPGPQLLKRALRDFSAKAEESFMIGDSRADMQAAQAAGSTGILIGTRQDEAACHAAPTFLAAARLVVALANRPADLRQ